ncbi:MAG: thiamine-phosphate kinase, partial [Candidatus Alkanophagales archaeon]
EGVALAETGVVTSMMDVSDGLAKSLHELSMSSGVGFEIHPERIPVPKELREALGERALELALYHGGDYELLFTVRRDGLDALKRVERETGTRISVIGEVKRLDEGIYMRDGRREKIELRGYLHFGAGATP